MIKIMNSSNKVSDKINLIDRKLYDKIQQQTNNDNLSTKIIRNAKYKKKHNSEFDLFSLIKEKLKKPTSQKLGKSKNAQRKVLSSTINNKFIKRRGKVRIGGVNKKRSKLKKAILRYRQINRKSTSAAIDHLSEKLEVLRVSNRVSIHSRRFRSYCNNCTTTQLAELTDKLLRDLDRFQKRARQQNEIKAHAKRRFVVGLRECTSFLRINKAKLVIIATDCEECAGEAGLDETIENIKLECHEKQIPCMFSMQRRQLSYVLFKKVPVSCVTILDYDGANETFAHLLLALEDARTKYTNLVCNETDLANTDNDMK